MGLQSGLKGEREEGGIHGEARQVYCCLDYVKILSAYLDDNLITEQRYLVIPHSLNEFSHIVYHSEAWSP